MKRLIFFFTLLGSVYLQAHPFKERLASAEKGDYVLFEQGQMYSLLSIYEMSEKRLILEEISIPKKSLPNKPSSWKEWVLQKGPGHSSWMMYEIDLEENTLVECFSFTRRAWLQLSEKESLFSHFLHLPMKVVPKEKRKKIGPPPSSGEIDIRPVWNPPMVQEGTRVKNPLFSVYHTKWPKDHSDLSEKTIALYFSDSPSFCFPFWIQVIGQHISVFAKVIDSGKGMVSPYQVFPRRPLEFLGMERKKQNLFLSIKSPSYFTKFQLMAVDITKGVKQMQPLSFSLKKEKADQFELLIPPSSLQQLTPYHIYLWQIIPEGHPECLVESREPFIFSENSLEL